MTKQEEEKLVKNLCMRIPYDVKVCVNGYIETLVGIYKDFNDRYMVITKNENNEQSYMQINHIKPYLRPLSSMSQEEALEYISTFNDDISSYSLSSIANSQNIKITNKPAIKITNKPTIDTLTWLISNHFDFTNLIDDNLALNSNI